MTKPALPVTRESARQWALGQAREPGLLDEYPHAEFNSDEESGGYAFTEPGHLYIAGFSGAYMVSVADDDYPALSTIERFWARERHQRRTIDIGVLGPSLRAAVTEVVGGHAFDGADPVLSAEDRAAADYLTIFLRRSLSRAAAGQNVGDALRVVAANDWMLGEPGRTWRTHPCPVCGAPALGAPDARYNSVCDDCYRRTVDSTGHRIAGYNTDIGGGFAAYYVDDHGATGDLCQEVTDTGRCWIGDVECHMGEARFGGVYVEVRRENLPDAR